MVMITFPFLYDLVGNYPISVADKKKSRSEFNILYKHEMLAIACQKIWAVFQVLESIRKYFLPKFA